MSWLARWRRSAPIETPYSDASERFDAPPASALSISVLAAWPQMVQLRGIGYDPARFIPMVGAEKAHGYARGPCGVRDSHRGIHPYEASRT